MNETSCDMSIRRLRSHRLPLLRYPSHLRLSLVADTTDTFGAANTSKTKRIMKERIVLFWLGVSAGLILVTIAVYWLIRDTRRSKRKAVKPDTHDQN